MPRFQTHTNKLEADDTLNLRTKLAVDDIISLLHCSHFPTVILLNTTTSFTDKFTGAQWEAP